MLDNRVVVILPPVNVTMVKHGKISLLCMFEYFFNIFLQCKFRSLHSSRSYLDLIFLCISQNSRKKAKTKMSGKKNKLDKPFFSFLRIGMLIF